MIAAITLVLFCFYLTVRLEPRVDEAVFLVATQLIGVIISVLLVQRLLEYRESRRWHAVNVYLYNRVYLEILVFVPEFNDIFGLPKPTVTAPSSRREFGVEYLNPRAMKEFLEALHDSLKESSDANASQIETNLRGWDKAKHVRLHKLLVALEKGIGDAYKEYPHEIPPEMLGLLLDATSFARTAALVSEPASYDDALYSTAGGLEAQHSLAGFQSKTILTMLGTLEKLAKKLRDEQEVMRID